MPNAGPDEIASVVLEQFDRQPQKRKPAVRDNGIHEWVPMSGIVAEGTVQYLHVTSVVSCRHLLTSVRYVADDRLTCLSLA